ncbi:MAG: LacI family DNA-binding transcriptional regulator [Flavobacteriaceae bacterium]|nr:LacI family DNA-binding transcriptional regulator [Flavobacteriaceae bacterium]
MSQNNVTLKQLALELNLSISTVSKALKDSYEINENTISRVKALAKKYNYKPNKIALNLKNRQTKTIGVIIPNILNYFFAKVLLGIEEQANKNGYQIIICLSNNKFKKEVECLDLLSDGSVDGYILSVAKETQKLGQYKHFQKIIDDGYPITMFDRVSQEIKHCDKVVIDDTEAAYKATRHLLKLNCKKIALVSTFDDIGIGKLRVQGYRKAISEHSAYASNELLASIHNKTDYETVIDQLLQEHPDVDGILATDNVSAITALRVAQRRNIHVPNDLCIIGFSDNKISRLSSPALTTVSQHPLEIGKTAVNLLLERINSNDQPQDYKKEIIESELTIRESTKKHPITA